MEVLALAVLGVVTVFGGPLDEVFWDSGAGSSLWTAIVVLAAGAVPSAWLMQASGRPAWWGAVAFTVLWVVGLVAAVAIMLLGGVQEPGPY